MNTEILKDIEYKPLEGDHYGWASYHWENGKLISKSSSDGFRFITFRHKNLPFHFQRRFPENENFQEQMEESIRAILDYSQLKNISKKPFIIMSDGPLYIPEWDENEKKWFVISEHDTKCY